jgi:predicted RNase H-like HicB family nuclease
VKTEPRYPINIHWSAEDGEWIATSPAWPGLSALESSPQKAVAELQKVMRLAAAANAAAARPVPEALSVAALKQAGGVIKISALAALAGIPAQTLHSKIRRGGVLSPDESAALHGALAASNLNVLGT